MQEKSSTIKGSKQIRTIFMYFTMYECIVSVTVIVWKWNSLQ